MMDAERAGQPGLRARLADLVERPRVQNAILTLILVNAVTLGLETSSTVMAAAGPWLIGLDRVILAVFVLELSLKIIGHGWRFFRVGWNLFDLVIVGIAVLPHSAAFSVLRALRILRLFRLLSIVPRMRLVVESLIRALPGLGSIALLLLLFFYVFAVMAVQLFGAEFPQWFGTLPVAMFSLFQIMTLEGWADIAREIMLRYPQAWLFFLVFILLATFTVLNLFIAIIVNAMQSSHDSETATKEAELNRQLREISSELRALRDRLGR